MTSWLKSNIYNVRCCSLDLLLIYSVDSARYGSFWSCFVNRTSIFHKWDGRNIEWITGLVVIVGAVGSITESAALIFPRHQRLLLAFLLISGKFSGVLLIFLSNLLVPFVALTLILIELLWLSFAFRGVGRCTFTLIFILATLNVLMWSQFGRNAPVALLIGLLLLITIAVETIFGMVRLRVDLSTTLHTI